MSMGIDAEGLFAIYADWIAFLREKRTMFEGQLAKVQGKELPGKAEVDLPANSNGKPAEARLVTNAIPLAEPPRVTKPEKTNKTVKPAQVFAGIASFPDPLPVSASESEAPPHEEIPEWLWPPKVGSSPEIGIEELSSSDEVDEDEETDDWM